MANVQLNLAPSGLSGILVPGDGVTFTATSESGDWPASTRLRVLNASSVETVFTPTIATTLATWTLTVAEVTALLGTKTTGSLSARITHGTGDSLRPVKAGRLSIVSKWDGVRSAQSLGTVTLGPPGLSAYEVAVAEGFIGDEAAWLASLVGEAGPAGTSATVTADDTPAAPAEGEAVSYFVTSAVSWPVGLVWSSEPDGDTEPTITGTALVSLFTVDGTTYAILGATFPAIDAPADTTAPTAGTLSVTAHASTTIDVSVSGAADETALHATPYAFSSDNGGTWGAYQAGATHQFTGLSPSTSYTVRHRVRDAAGNVSTGTGVAQSTDAAADTTAPTVGTMAASSITSSGFVLTISGAADETALHATPYDFTLDNGATWKGYQAGAVYTASGLTAETGYTCNWRVRDAAGNVSTGTPQTVTTSAAAAGPLVATLTDTNSDANSAASYNMVPMQTLAVGTAAADRTVVVAFGALYTGGAFSCTGVTINGTAATIDYQRQEGYQLVGFARLAVPTGTTANVAVTFSAAALDCEVATIAITGGSVAVSATNGAANAATVTIPTGGVGIWAAIDRDDPDNLMTWTGVTESWDDAADAAAARRWSGAIHSTAGATTGTNNGPAGSTGTAAIAYGVT